MYLKLFRIFKFCDINNEIVLIDQTFSGSIISKKAAESLDALVLDVKFGVGAVIQDKDQSRKLAEKMVER